MSVQDGIQKSIKTEDETSDNLVNYTEEFNPNLLFRNAKSHYSIRWYICIIFFSFVLFRLEHLICMDKLILR